jgi:DNA-binding transcriptional LysR family regulator
VEFVAQTRKLRFMVDLRRLLALRELADRGTIAAAADALQLTPSAVSQQLAALEREIGQPLVEPDGRSVRLTPAARVLLGHGEALFAQLELLRADLDAHAAGEAGVLRVGSFATGISGLVVPTVAALRERAPGLRVLISEAETDEAFLGLARHELDVVMAMEADGVPQEDDARFARRPLMADVLDAAVRADHPLANAERLDLRDLSGNPWVAPPVGWSCESVLLTGCRSVGFTPRIEHRCGDWRAVLAMVATGLGVTLVPRLAGIRATDEVAIIPLTGIPPARHLFAACRRGAEEAPATRALLDALGEVARDVVGAPVGVGVR